MKGINESYSKINYYTNKKQCQFWSEDRDERPSFKEIIEELKNNDEFNIEIDAEDEFLGFVEFIENSDKLFKKSIKFIGINLLSILTEKVAIVEQQPIEKNLIRRIG